MTATSRRLSRTARRVPAQCRGRRTTVLLDVSGDVDLSTGPALQDRVAALLRAAGGEAGATEVVLDLSGITFLDCAGLGYLRQLQELGVRDGRVRLVAPSAAVLRLLDVVAAPGASASARADLSLR